MMLSLQPISTADLLLSRLLFADTQGMTISDLKRAVKAITGTELANSALTEQVTTALTALGDQGHVQSVSRSRYRITDPGRRQILNHLGLTTVPPQLRWNTVQNADWIAYALKLPRLSSATRQQIVSADGLRAAILRQGYGLPVNDFAALTETRNALLWQHLCSPETAANLQQRLPELRGQAFNQGTVMGALLNELLQTTRPLPWEKALAQLVAKVAGAKQTAPAALRIAILRRALLTSPPVVPQELTLPEFARITLQAARETKDGWLGNHKVFISKVWDTLYQQRPDLQLTLEEFKQHLITAHQQQFLTLSRNDSPHNLDSDEVTASEISYLNATFHLIRTD